MADPPHHRLVVSFGDGGQWQHDSEHALIIFSGNVTLSLSPNIPEPAVPPRIFTAPLVYVTPVPPGFITEAPPGFLPHRPPAPAPALAPIIVPPLAFAAAPSSSEESDSSEDSDSSEETDPISPPSSIDFSSESSSASNSVTSTATSRQKRMTAPEYRASFQLRAPSDSSPTEYDGSNRRNQDPGPSRGPSSSPAARPS